MSLWWLQPGWTDARCSCGAKIWPEGDPDWGACFQCFSAQLEQQYPTNEDPSGQQREPMKADPLDDDLPF